MFKKIIFLLLISCSVLAENKENKIDQIITAGVSHHLIFSSTPDKNLINTREDDGRGSDNKISASLTVNQLKIMAFIDYLNKDLALDTNTNNFYLSQYKLDKKQNPNKSFYDKYQQYLNKQFIPIKNWSQLNLGSPKQHIFYPFGGPDLLHLIYFFPEAQTYTLMGLEEAGELPEINSSSQNNSDQLILYNNISQQIGLNFFRTKEMAKKINSQSWNGVGAMFIFYLHTHGYKINDYHLKKNQSAKYQKLTINFSDQNGNNQKQLIYYQINLENSYLKDNLFNDLLREQYDYTMVKAASYLMWEKNFSKIKEVVLTRSRNIIMDSSAMPIKQLNSFDITVYGDYRGPIKLFKNYLDKDLLDIQKNNIPLLFSYGYLDGGLPTHLIIARKNKL